MLWLRTPGLVINVLVDKVTLEDRYLRDRNHIAISVSICLIKRVHIWSQIASAFERPHEIVVGLRLSRSRNSSGISRALVCLSGQT